MFLRKIHGSRLNIFQPIADLSSLSKMGSEGRALVAGQNNDVAIAGGQILGDEYSDHVVKARIRLFVVLAKVTTNLNRTEVVSFYEKGIFSPPLHVPIAHTHLGRTLLKSDQWHRESHHVSNGVRGAINFRNIPGTQIYALGQPTLDAIDEVVSRVRDTHPSAERIIWITLREEPIVYINGAPYCLRRERFTLRNMKGKSLPYEWLSLVPTSSLARLRRDISYSPRSTGGTLEGRRHRGAQFVWRQVSQPRRRRLRFVTQSNAGQTSTSYRDLGRFCDPCLGGSGQR